MNSIQAKQAARLRARHLADLQCESRAAGPNSTAMTRRRLRGQHGGHIQGQWMPWFALEQPDSTLNPGDASGFMRWV